MVKDAHKGEGLGNKFLSHIKETDAIIHLFHAFEDKDIVHVSGEVAPLEDIETIKTELILADLAIIEKHLRSSERQARSGDKEEIERRDGLKKYFELLSDNHMAREASLTKEERAQTKDVELLTLKPVIYVANVKENDLETSLPNDIKHEPLIKICAKLESEIADLESAEATEYMKELGIKESGLDHLIRESYRVLNLITFFTAGPKEVHAWTVRKGSNAKTAAGKIHSDFAERFIRAEVIPYTDYISSGGEQAAKDAGVMRIEGKDYIVQDGDVIYFRVGTS